MPRCKAARRGRTLLVIPSGLWWLMAVPLAAAKAGDPGAICDGAAARAAMSSDVPLDVLRAITRTETGRKGPAGLQPWPWTVNMEGKGRWFDTRAEALAYAVAEHARGARSFDIGCFQINYRWHGDNFASIDEMFDPVANALYAARFLSSLHAESGDWSKAAGAYHSRTETYATRYRARFDRLRQSLPDTPPPLVLSSTRREGPGYPLFQGASRPAQLGSLLPLAAADGSPALFGTARRASLFSDGRG